MSESRESTADPTPRSSHSDTIARAIGITAMIGIASVAILPITWVFPVVAITTYEMISLYRSK